MEAHGYNPDPDRSTIDRDSRAPPPLSVVTGSGSLTDSSAIIKMASETTWAVKLPPASGRLFSLELERWTERAFRRTHSPVPCDLTLTAEEDTESRRQFLVTGALKA